MKKAPHEELDTLLEQYAIVKVAFCKLQHFVWLRFGLPLFTDP
jgi:hypothetical protein